MNIITTVVHDMEAGSRDLATQGKSLFGIEIIRRASPDNEIVNSAMKSTDTVKVFQHKRFFGLGRSLFWGFEPLVNVRSVGIIIYPGSLVEVRAYAPIAKRMAENGYHAAIATPPLSLASFDSDLADDVINFGWKDEIKAWSISGHSQGGALACAYANNNRDSDVLKGVALLAAYPGESNFFNGNLSDSDFIVKSIYGSLDGIALYEDVVVKATNLLPPSTSFVEIKGGNHTQFSYADGLQVTGDKTDGIATIALEDQQDVICKTMLGLLGETTPLE